MESALDMNGSSVSEGVLPMQRVRRAELLIGSAHRGLLAGRPSEATVLHLRYWMEIGSQVILSVKLRESDSD